MMGTPTSERAVPPLSALADLRPGDEIATYTWPPITRTQLAFYCAASGVTDPIHYDLTMAREHHFEDLVVNGSFRVGMFELLIRHLWPGQADLEELRCRHSSGVLVDSAVTTRVLLRAAGRDACELELTHAVADRITDSCSARLKLLPYRSA